VLPAVLSSCGIDEKSPFLREWSILALRNICLFNDRNRSFVAQLQAQEIPEHVRVSLSKKGIDVSLGENGQVRVKQLAREDDK
jgi:ataxin-10